jgi:hypothetical protein
MEYKVRTDKDRLDKERIDKELPEATQKCIDLFLEGKSIEDIHRITGYTIRSIAMRLSKSGYRNVVREKKRLKTKSQMVEELNSILGLNLDDLERLNLSTLALLIEKFTS